MPEFLVILEATDDLLKSRVNDMSESDIVARNYDQQGFTKKLQTFKENNTEDKGLATFFEEKEGILPIYLHSNEAISDLLAEVRKVVGKPHNYGPSSEELSQKMKAEQLLAEERQKKAQQEKETLEKLEKQERDRRETEWAAKAAKLEQEEREVLELQSAPFRTYLMDNIMPTLTTGLIEICKIRPTDPIDYLAEYLFKHSN
jgi:adenylate kinase